MTKVAVLIDGGHVRALAQKAGLRYRPALIANIASLCATPGEEITRVLYYDCAPYTGAARLPISGNTKKFEGDASWLSSLAQMDLFAVRLGVLKFRGFKPKQTPVNPLRISDDDFVPTFEQKGVDMRIGLDMANYSATRAVDRIILLSADTDCIPAMKYARRSGLQVVIVKLPGAKVHGELRAHADMTREIDWPEPAGHDVVAPEEPAPAAE